MALNPLCPPLPTTWAGRTHQLPSQMTHVAPWGVFRLISFSSTFLSQHSLHNVLCNSYNSDQSRNGNVIQSLSNRIKNMNNTIFKTQHFGKTITTKQNCEVLHSSQRTWFLIPGLCRSNFQPPSLFLCSRGFCSSCMLSELPAVLSVRSDAQEFHQEHVAPRTAGAPPQLWLIRGIFSTAFTETLELWVKMEGAVVNRDLHHPPNRVVLAVVVNKAVIECIPKMSVDTHNIKTQEEKSRLQQQLTLLWTFVFTSSIEHLRLRSLL